MVLILFYFTTYKPSLEYILWSAQIMSIKKKKAVYFFFSSRKPFRLEISASAPSLVRFYCLTEKEKKKKRGGGIIVVRTNCQMNTTIDNIHTHAHIKKKKWNEGLPLVLLVTESRLPYSQLSPSCFFRVLKKKEEHFHFWPVEIKSIWHLLKLVETLFIWLFVVSCILISRQERGWVQEMTSSRSDGLYVEANQQHWEWEQPAATAQRKHEPRPVVSILSPCWLSHSSSGVCV